MFNIAVAQSGGPTAAINASLTGVFNGAEQEKEVDEIYGAENVVFEPNAEKAIRDISALDPEYSRFPVCMAKTQYSLSDDPKKLGRPTGFTLTVREVRLSAGAGFIVVLTGSVLTMPGLPKKPAAVGIDVDDSGKITGLF